MFSTLVQAQINALEAEPIEWHITPLIKRGLCAFRNLSIVALKPSAESTLLQGPVLTNEKVKKGNEQVVLPVYI